MKISKSDKIAILTVVLALVGFFTVYYCYIIGNLIIWSAWIIFYVVCIRKNNIGGKK